MYNMEMNLNKGAKMTVRITTVIVLLIIVIVFVLNNVYTVNTGEVAIISRFGKVHRIDSEGLNFKLPIIEDKVFMETREKTYIFGLTEEADTTLEVSTKDMQSVRVDLTVQANIVDPEKLYRAFANKHEYRFIRPRVKEVVQSTIAKYSIEEFVSKRSEISSIISTDVSDDLAEYGINVNNVSIVNHDFSDDYEKAIEAKKVAEQSVERARAEQQKLLVEYENRVKIAELELKEKELQAKANMIESNSLTPILIQKMTIEKWDGVLPRVTDKNGMMIKLD